MLDSDRYNFVPLLIIGAGVHGTNVAQEWAHGVPDLAAESLTVDESDVTGGQFRKISLELNSRNKPSRPDEYASLPTGVDGNINPLGEYSTVEVSGISSATFPSSQELGKATAVNSFFSANVALRTKHIRTVPNTTLLTGEYETTLFDLDTNEEFKVYSDAVIGTSGNGSIRYGVERYLPDGTPVIDEDSGNAIDISQDRIAELRARLNRGQEINNLKPNEIPPIMTQVEVMELFARPENTRPLEAFSGKDIAVVGGGDGLWTTLEFYNNKSPTEYNQSVPAVDSVGSITAYGAPGLTAEDLKYCRDRYARNKLDFRRADGRPGKVRPVLEKAQRYKVIESGPNAGMVEVTYFNSDTLELETAIHSHVIVVPGYETRLQDQYEGFDTTENPIKPQLTELDTTPANIAAALTVPGSLIIEEARDPVRSIIVTNFDRKTGQVSYVSLDDSTPDAVPGSAVTTTQTLAGILEELTTSNLITFLKIPEDSCSIYADPKKLETFLSRNDLAKTLLVDDLAVGTTVSVGTGIQLLTFEVLDKTVGEDSIYTVRTNFSTLSTEVGNFTKEELLNRITGGRFLEYRLTPPPDYSQLSNALITPGSTLIAPSTVGTSRLLTVDGPPDFSDPDVVQVTINTFQPTLYAPDSAIINGNSFTAPLDDVLAKLKTVDISSITVPKPPKFVKTLPELTVDKDGLQYSVGRRIDAGVFIAGPAANLSFSPYELSQIPPELLRVLNADNTIAMWRQTPQVTELVREFILGNNGRGTPGVRLGLMRLRLRRLSALSRLSSVTDATEQTNGQLFPSDENLQKNELPQVRRSRELQRGFSPDLDLRELLAIRINHYLQKVPLDSFPIERSYGAIEGKPIGQMKLKFTRTSMEDNGETIYRFSVSSETPLPTAFGRELLADGEFCRILDRVMPPNPRRNKEQAISIIIPVGNSKNGIKPLPELAQIDTLNRISTPATETLSSNETRIRRLIEISDASSLVEAVRLLAISQFPENDKQRLRENIVTALKNSFDTILEEAFSKKDPVLRIDFLLDEFNYADLIIPEEKTQFEQRLIRKTNKYAADQCFKITSLAELEEIVLILVSAYRANGRKPPEAVLKDVVRTIFARRIREVFLGINGNLTIQIDTIVNIAEQMLRIGIYDTSADFQDTVRTITIPYGRGLIKRLKDNALLISNDDLLVDDFRQSLSILQELRVLTPKQFKDLDLMFFRRYSTSAQIRETMISIFKGLRTRL